MRIFGTNQVIKLKEDKLKALEPRQAKILNDAQGLIDQIWYAETSVFANPYYEEMKKLNQIYEILNDTQVDVFCKKKLVQSTLDMFKNKSDTHGQLVDFMSFLQQNLDIL